MNAIMQGFPPMEADRAELKNWRNSPYNHWSFHHVREIVPSAEIAHDPDDVWRLGSGGPDLSGAGIEETMAAVEGDAVAVIHEGRLVGEYYRRGMGPRDPHILMSVSKSMLGLVAGTLVERGELAEDDPVTKYAPELAGAAHDGATVRDLLDMRAGVLFDEDYLVTEGPIVDYRFAANWNPVPEGREAGDLRSFMSRLCDRDGPHGGRFHYVSPNTDLLAWIFERATGTRYADLVAERLFRPLGAETAGYITVDRIGGARAAGGKCFTARDLARVGAMVAEGGRRGDDGRQGIPESWIDDIERNGDPAAWAEGDFADKFSVKDMHYRSKWYVQRGETTLMHGLGIHGQYVFVDRARRLAISWFSSRHAPTDEASTEAVLACVGRIREAVS